MTKFLMITILAMTLLWGLVSSVTANEPPQPARIVFQADTTYDQAAALVSKYRLTPAAAKILRDEWGYWGGWNPDYTTRQGQTAFWQFLYEDAEAMLRWHDSEEAKTISFQVMNGITLTREEAMADLRADHQGALDSLAYFKDCWLTNTCPSLHIAEIEVLITDAQLAAQLLNEPLIASVKFTAKKNPMTRLKALLDLVNLSLLLNR